MILIIDDDAAVRSSLTFLLKRAGFEPEAVPGPEEALVVVRQTTLQLILMDMNFTLTTTGEEGIQLLKQVKVFQPGYSDDGMGIYFACRTGNASRSFRFCD